MVYGGKYFPSHMPGNGKTEIGLFPESYHFITVQVFLITL